MNESTLDPPSWDALRAVSHRVLDTMLDHLEHVRTRPAWQPVPAAVRHALRQPVPRTGIGLDAVWEATQRLVVPYSWGNTHPRFWGWVNGSGTPGGVVAELVTGALNTNAALGQQAAVFVEQQVLEWSRELLGFPADGGGLLVTGGSVANLVGLTLGRDARGGDIAARGLQAQSQPLVFYASSETHNSAEKAAMILGLGREGYHKVPVDAEYRIDLDALRRAIASDRAAGRRPCAVVGNAGTVGTGAFDDLEALADLCAAEGMWLHVDGAFGAMAALVPALRPLVRGMDRADSLAFDFHKWLHVPYDAGCVLVRDRRAHEGASFHAQASYLATLERGSAAGPDFTRIGPELSREFRALKIWMSLLEHGADAFAALIEQNVAQAHYLAERIRLCPELELLAPVPLNVVCYRFRDPRVTGAALNDLNQELVMRLQERGIAVPSSTVLEGRFAVRVAITNHRSRREDFDTLLDASLAIGHELAAHTAAA